MPPLFSQLNLLPEQPVAPPVSTPVFAPEVAKTAKAVKAVKGSVSYDEFQRSVIECEDWNIVVRARAGAGKTTTAIGFTEARMGSTGARFLYLCFGKANQVEAQARFGAHVECRTGHSLAYGAIGYRFRDQIAMQSWSARDFAAQMKIANIRTAAIVQDILGVFFTSIDLNVSASHIAEVSGKWGIAPNEYDQLFAYSRLAWSKIQQPGSGVSMPPDGYLKMWALTNPKLTKYTHIILDEGQDTNPVMAQIVRQQTHVRKLIIGDHHQSIFLFRGATNAMEEFAAEGATVFEMPRTWRFGPKIAGAANDLLEFFKFETVKIIGAGPGSKAPNKSQRLVLSRTNAGLYAEAASVLGKHTHWLGGIHLYRLDMLLDSFRLKMGRVSEINDPALRSFASWGQYRDEAEKAMNAEAKLLIKLNDQYGSDIPKLVKAFYDNALPTEVGAKLKLATAHRAKGLESDIVQIGEDFTCTKTALDQMMLYPKMRLTPVMEQEINLLYVAMTRARHTLNLNFDTADFLKNIERHRQARARAWSRPGSTGDRDVAGWHP